ncbi:MAG: hypothetical protein GXO43_07585 [Crenarchaeota archaeon]|nr:hypothetical protein [Thermoproteota archaeon]
MSREEVLKEIKRKSIHVIPGFFAIPFIEWLGKPYALAVSILFFTLYALNEYALRTGKKWKVPIAGHTYEIMARKEELEKKTFIGTVYFWGLTILIIALLPPQQAAAAVMISSFGDAAAAIVGKALGGPRVPYNRRKTIAGSISMFIVSLLSCMAAGIPVQQGLLVSLISTIAESATRISVNDEITVPVVSSVSLYIFSII